MEKTNMSKRLSKGNMSILDFQKRFDTEDKCRDYFIQLRFPNGFKCPHCGGTTCGQVKTRNLLRCKSCRKQISVTSGTVFHRTHLSLLQIIWAMYLFANDKRGCSAVQIQRNLKVNYDTALYLLQRLRKAMKSRDDQYMLDGIVELDDTYVGTSTHGKKRGRGTEKAKVIVAVSQTDNGKAGFIKMQVVSSLKATTFGRFAQKYIAEGTHIESDGYASLIKGVAKKYFVHYETFSPDKEMLLNLHTAISNMKALINGTYHGVTKARLQEYLDEFAFRFNRKSFREHLFERLAAAIFL